MRGKIEVILGAFLSFPPFFSLKNDVLFAPAPEVSIYVVSYMYAYLSLSHFRPTTDPRTGQLQPNFHPLVLMRRSLSSDPVILLPFIPTEKRV